MSTADSGKRRSGPGPPSSEPSLRPPDLHLPRPPAPARLGTPAGGAWLPLELGPPGRSPTPAAFIAQCNDTTPLPCPRAQGHLVGRGLSSSTAAGLDAPLARSSAHSPAATPLATVPDPAQPHTILPGSGAGACPARLCPCSQPVSVQGAGGGQEGLGHRTVCGTGRTWESCPMLAWPGAGEGGVPDTRPWCPEVSPACPRQRGVDPRVPSGPSQPLKCPASP